MSTRPTAVVTIEPRGPRTIDPRDYSITLAIKLSTIDAKYADRNQVARLLRDALAASSPPDGQPSRQTVDDMIVSSRASKTGAVSRVVAGVEGGRVLRGKPGAAAVEALRAVLEEHEYRVTIHERRECAEATCLSDAMVDWNRSGPVPAGWFSDAICGKHNYRACAQCNSLYAMTSESCSVPAPSLHCTVCGVVMIEWGGSKTWNAELVTRAAWSSGHRPSHHGA